WRRQDGRTDRRARQNLLGSLGGARVLPRKLQAYLVGGQFRRAPPSRVSRTHGAGVVVGGTVALVTTTPLIGVAVFEAGTLAAELPRLLAVVCTPPAARAPNSAATMMKR